MSDARPLLRGSAVKISNDTRLDEIVLAFTMPSLDTALLICGIDEGKTNEEVEHA